MVSESEHESTGGISCNILVFFSLGCINQPLTDMEEKKNAFTPVSGIKYNLVTRRASQRFVHSEGTRDFQVHGSGVIFRCSLIKVINEFLKSNRCSYCELILDRHSQYQLCEPSLWNLSFGQEGKTSFAHALQQNYKMQYYKVLIYMVTQDFIKGKVGCLLSQIIFLYFLSLQFGSQILPYSHLL